MLVLELELVLVLDEVLEPVDDELSVLELDDELESLLVAPELLDESEDELAVKDDAELESEDELEDAPVELALELVPEPEVLAVLDAPDVLAAELVLIGAQMHAAKPWPSARQTWPPWQPPTPTQATDWPGMQRLLPLEPDELDDVETGLVPAHPAATTASTHSTLRMTPPDRSH